MAGIDTKTLGAAQAYTEEKIKEAGGMTSEGVAAIVKDTVGSEMTAYLPEYLAKNGLVEENITLNLSDVKNGYATGTVGATVTFGSSSATLALNNVCKVIKGVKYRLSVKNAETVASSNQRDCFICSDTNIILQKMNLSVTAGEIDTIVFTPTEDGNLTISVDKNYESIELICVTKASELEEKIIELESDVLYSELKKTESIYYSQSKLYVRKEDGIVVSDKSSKEKSIHFKLNNNSRVLLRKPYYSNRFKVFLFYSESLESAIENSEQGLLVFDNDNASEVEIDTYDYNYCVVYINNQYASYQLSEISEYPLFVSYKYANYSVSASEWESGGISYSDGSLNDDSNTSRLNKYISSYDFDGIMLNKDIVCGIRAYDSDYNFVYATEIKENVYTKFESGLYYKVILKTTAITDNIITLRINGFAGDSKISKKMPIDENWRKWSDVRYYYGFDKAKQPIFNTVNGVLESDTMMSVRGGKGRWNHDDKPESTFVSGGHVFEGWSGEELARLTMLIGKFHETFACIQTYSPAGLYETNRRFGWVKMGSDEKNKGVDFSQGWSTFYTPLTLNRLASAPTSVSDYDLNPQFSDSSIPVGTMYYDTTIQKVRVYTTDGWKDLAFED